MVELDKLIRDLEDKLNFLKSYQEKLDEINGKIDYIRQCIKNESNITEVERYENMINNALRRKKELEDIILKYIKDIAN